MVGKLQVRTAAVDVERLTQRGAAHGRALDVPARAAAAPGRFPAGQVVGNMKEETSVRQVMQDLMQEYIDTAERISPLINL